MLLAELEIWHTRPLTPTRRVSLGHMVLPTDPAPGFGGLLLSAIVARHIIDVEEELIPDTHRLVAQIERNERVAQPRLRHRYQVDRHGMARSLHRLVGTGEDFAFEFDTQGNPMQQVLGAIYSLERLDVPSRKALAPLLVKSLNWRGPLGQAFVSHLVGTKATSLRSIGDPRAWALEILGFPMGTVKPTRSEVMAQYRNRLRAVHPDHGGNQDSASKSIGDLGEARRILID
ncbi:MAG: hypothetical protein ACK49V_12115 [Actinomycetes bacterium]